VPSESRSGTSFAEIQRGDIALEQLLERIGALLLSEAALGVAEVQAELLGRLEDVLFFFLELDLAAVLGGSRRRDRATASL
jgi:hypothetical protein